ncbi:MAG: hypothetical protein HYY85_12000, partial [Deltaproteobacteria bacterium]|nr:hypothetical protein [Deltaproteobacteria bacterium]
MWGRRGEGSGSLRIREFAVGRTVGASLLLASLLTVPVNTLAQAPQKVTFNMGWLPQGSMMGFA